FSHFRPHDELGMVKDRMNAVVNGRFQHSVLALEVDKFHFYLPAGRALSIQLLLESRPAGREPYRQESLRLVRKVWTDRCKCNRLINWQDNRTNIRLVCPN